MVRVFYQLSMGLQPRVIMALADILIVIQWIVSMAPYTLTIREAETQLRQLVQRTQTTHQPVVLTTEETAKPLAVVMEMNAFEQTQRDRLRLFQLQRIHLAEWLDRAEQQWQDEAIRQACVTTWQQSVKSLWEVCPQPVRVLCANLALAVKRLKVAHFSLEQIVALRYCLELLRDAAPDQAEIEIAYQQLIDSQLPPRLAFDDSIIQSYIDEL